MQGSRSAPSSRSTRSFSGSSRRRRTRDAPGRIRTHRPADWKSRCGVAVDLGRRRSELLDDESGMLSLDAVDHLEDRRDLVDCLVGVSLDVELDECRVTIGREEPGLRVRDRRDDALDVRLLGKRARHARDCRHECRVVGFRGSRLHEHALACRNVEIRLVEDPLGATGLAVRYRPVLHLVRTDGAPDDDREGSERDPSECSRLPMRCAPATRSAQRDCPSSLGPFLPDLSGLHRR
jgi:hypothetical protein